MQIDIISRLHDFPDDGHAIKLGRAALICQEACREYEGTPVGDRFMIKGEDMWQRVLGLIVDSVEAPGPNWVRSAGFEEAWEVSVLISDSVGKARANLHVQDIPEA